MEIRVKKNYSIASRLSSSLKVINFFMFMTRIDRLCDFLFRSNHGPISYRFRDKRRFQSNIANFPYI